MNEQDLRRVADFISGLKKLEAETLLTISDGHIWDNDGDPLCKIDQYEIETI